MIYSSLDTDTLVYLAKCWEDQGRETGTMDYVAHCLVVRELNNRGVYEW